MCALIEREKAVIRSAKSGDPQAFQVLYDGFRNYVYRRCLRLTRDPRLSEDLTQDVFVQAWKKIGGFRGDASFKTWLHRITTNIVSMHYRQAQRRAQHQQPYAAPEGGPSAEELLPSPPALLDERLLLCQMMSSLTPNYRAVLILHDVKGYKHDEIAEILGVPSGTSKSNLYRARLQLRKVLMGRPPGTKTREALAKAA